MEKLITIPDFLAYPKISSLTRSEFKNVFCYVFKAYPRKGVMLLVLREKGDVVIKAADWDCKPIDLAQAPQNQLSAYFQRLVLTMRLIQIPKAIYYFTDDGGYKLVDMRLSINKFCGPGYLNDFFGRQSIPIQEKIGNPLILNEDVIARMLEKQPPYDWDILVKPSAFKSIIDSGQIIPLYGVNSREAK